MAAMLRRLPALAGLAVVAGTGAEVAGHRAFTRMVRRDVRALSARAARGRAGVVTEEMLADLPEPGRMLVKVASLWPVVDASGEQMDQAGMMRYLSEMLWFPAAFLGANISFDAVGDSSARVTLTDHDRTATGTLVFDEQGRATDLVAERYRTPTSSDPETWSTPITGYGEFEGLLLPARGKAIYKLPGGDLEYIDVTVTDLHYDTSAAALAGSV